MQFHKCMRCILYLYSISFIKHAAGQQMPAAAYAPLFSKPFTCCCSHCRSLVAAADKEPWQLNDTFFIIITVILCLHLNKLASHAALTSTLDVVLHVNWMLLLHQSVQLFSTVIALQLVWSNCQMFQSTARQPLLQSCYPGAGTAGLKTSLLHQTCRHQFWKG